MSQNLSKSSGGFPVLEYLPSNIIDKVLMTDQRVLLFGQPGIGKSTLAAKLGHELFNAGRSCTCIGADPGSPGFGVPGALCCGEWTDNAWRLTDMEALCSLDAGRFRLPLLYALERLIKRTQSKGLLLIDAPGVVRGGAGAELLMAIVEATAIDMVLALVREGESLPLQQALNSLQVKVCLINAAEEACRPGKKARARNRTRLWDSYLQQAEERSIDFSEIPLIGMPPSLDEADLWCGRQIALLEGRRTLALGEVLMKEESCLRIRMPPVTANSPVLLVRDVQRTQDGVLNTAKPVVPPTLWYTPPPDMMYQPDYDTGGGPRPVVTMGVAHASLINGVFGDPLLHLRLRHQRRSLLFDLGEAGRLPSRIAHQVSDVFISHAHIDHIGGFLWLLRSRIGDLPACRVFGPPGVAEHLWGLMCGIHWDRIGENGPIFEIAEVRRNRLERFRIQAGRPKKERLGKAPLSGGLLLDEAAFRVRTVTLDHGIPVLAFAFEPRNQLNVRKEQLLKRCLQPGPWLNKLKQRFAAGETDALVQLPDGSMESVAKLGETLLKVSSGQKLVYATDLADSAENRERLIALAEGTHTLFCEAAFTDADREQARYTSHLTARACGEIAVAVHAKRLVPFHFSRRYESNPELVYSEVLAACPRAVLPERPLINS
jgi:ribonuclease BN (tRNA processing enzyme)